MEDLTYYDEIHELLHGITLEGPSLFIATPPPSQYVFGEFDILPEDRFTELPPEFDADRGQVDKPALPATIEAASTQPSQAASEPKKTVIGKR
jgi:hypothetical protein